VLVKGKRVRCRPEELGPVSATVMSAAAREERKAERRAEHPRIGGARRDGNQRSGSDLDESVSVPPEINLIGQRIEPALEELDVYIDRALLAARREVRIIHGHGSGKLRQAVREHLRGHRGVANLREGAPNEGGNGATVVSLRGA
jgi:dsDNA-specific endonuclease/ATPase MutS2